MEASIVERIGLGIVLTMLALSLLSVVDAATGAHLAHALVGFLVDQVSS